MELTKEVSPVRDLKHGRATIGLEPQPIFLTTDLRRGCLVQADSSNTASIFLGGPNVSPSNGFPIAAGKALVLPVDDPSGVYAVSTDMDQNLAWMGI